MQQAKFNKWLDHIIQNESPDSNIIAYYFGIFETENGFETYVIGSKEFDENDDDWACNVDFEPINKYLELGQINTDWQQILAQNKEYIKAYMQSENFKGSFLDKSKVIATGFDGGDLFILKQ